MSGPRYFSAAIARLEALLGEHAGGGAWKLPLLVLLEGNLGAGKTTFVKEILEHWGCDATRVQSPTFLKVLEHHVPKLGLCLHWDCYRIEDVEELDRLGLENYLDASVWFVEWPEILEKYFSLRPDVWKLLGFREVLRLKFDVAPDGSRSLIFTES